MRRCLAILFAVYIPFPMIVNSAIRVGHPFYKPPFVINANKGFDLALMKYICSQLKKKCDFYPMAFESLFLALDNGSIDIAIGGINITDWQAKHYLFSLPYKITKGQFLVLKGSGISHYKALDNKRVGTIRGSDFEEFLSTDHRKNWQIILLDEVTLLFNKLNQKGIDAVFLDAAVIDYWAHHHDAYLRVGNPIFLGDGFGVMTTPNNDVLIKQINAILLQMESDGTWEKLYNNYINQSHLSDYQTVLSVLLSRITSA
ncbi:TPA: transporter substrate-binding domain-containing protein, partial [Legionella pneumophila]|nr:transporter substrate-binding domain-containing protein [Legionella pneumophila]